ncbi:hypothetical protein ACFS27_10965 [Promicromonospora vindobonensis]|uniref:Secreted protein n=1 Tax=Promicromonospora vindobonensis TaxID=195748 RepID=A0ABW5VUL8_9MICO
MNIGDTDVLARLKAGADSVEEHPFDADAVLAGSRRALRRRRTRQAAGACTTAAAVVFSLALAGPVPVPGVGDVTLPGSEQVRELFGLADASRCDVPEPAVRRTPEPAAPAHLRPRVTYTLTDARPLSTCFDVRVDDTVPGVGRAPDTLTPDGAFWGLSQPETEDEYSITYHVLGAGSGSGFVTGDANTLVSGLTAHGRQVAWYELSGSTPEELVDAPYRLRAASTVAGDVRTIAQIPRGGTVGLTMTDERIAWRHGTTVSVAPADGTGQPRTLARQATAVGSDSDEIVVASLGQDADGLPTTTFTAYGDDGGVTTLLTVANPGDPVSIVDITDDVLAYGAGDGLGGLTVVPRADGIADPDEDQTVVVRLGDNAVEGLSAAGDAVAWVSGPVAYLLRDTAPSRAGGPDLLRVAQSGQRERMMIGLAGDRIAWSTTDGSAARIKIATLLEPERAGATTGPAPAEPGSGGRAVPAAPRVTVPENADLPTLD